MTGNVKQKTWHKGGDKILFRCLILNRVCEARVSGMNSVAWIETQGVEEGENVSHLNFFDKVSIFYFNQELILQNIYR